MLRSSSRAWRNSRQLSRALRVSRSRGDLGIGLLWRSTRVISAKGRQFLDLHGSRRICNSGGKRQVVAEESVAGTKGWRLDGPMGMTRIAWKSSVLWAEEMPGCRFYPPVPILNSTAEAKSLGWTGRLWVMGRSLEATGEVNEGADKFEIAGRKYEAVVSTLSLASGKTQIELKTWLSMVSVQCARSKGSQARSTLPQLI